MRKIAQAAVVLWLALSVGSLQSAPSAPENEEQAAITPGGIPSPFKTEAQAEAAAVKALGGDPDEAWGLSLYFSGQRYDRERADYWMQIAADNGNANALHGVATKLYVSGNPCDLLRAIYYLELTVKFLPQNDTHQIAMVKLEIASDREQLRKMSTSNCLRTVSR